MQILEITAKINAWIAQHWQKVLMLMCGVILLQQCTINSLQRKIIQMEGIKSESLASAEPDTTDGNGTATANGNATNRDTTITALPDNLTISSDEQIEAPRSNWTLVFILMGIAAAVAGFWYMRKNAIFPIGLMVWGRLHLNEATGDLTYHLCVRNTSSKTFEVSDAVTNFIIRGGTRRFRATMDDLPMLLQPGTKFETTISLTGLVSRNIELQQAKAISMSIVCDNKKHTTLPSPIRFGN